MKTITLEIECGESACDKCICLGEVADEKAYCALHDLVLDQAPQRCQECLDSQHRFSANVM